MIILPCIPFLFSGSYITYVFLLAYVFSLVFALISGKR